MMSVKTIRRPPSLAKALTLLGEWSRFDRRGGQMTPARAQEIAAQFFAAGHAKRIGAVMPKDWRSGHPSLPMQFLAWHEKIVAHPIVATANHVQAYDFELNK